jgi:Fe-S oxidoreductase
VILPILFSVAVLFIVVPGLAYMALSLARIGTMLNVGVRDEPLADFVKNRINVVVSIVFGHKKNLEDRLSGTLHIIIMYTFFVLMIGHVEIVIEGLTYFLKAFGMQPFLYERLPGLSHHHAVIRVFHLTQDLAAGLVFCAEATALARRVSGVTPRLMPRSGDGEVILLFGLTLYTTFFMMNATGRLIHDNFVWHFDWSQPFSSLFAYPWQFLADRYSIQAIHMIMWWAHVLAFVLFGCYIPSSKHMHIAFAGVNTFMFKKGPYAWRQPEIQVAEKAKPPQERARAKALPPKIDFEVAEEYGLSRITQLPVKTLLDSVSCTECGRCNAVCPANLTHKPLKPKKIVRDIKRNLLRHNGPALLQTRDLFGRPVEANAEAEKALELFPLISKIEVDHDNDAQVRPLDGQYNDVDGSIHVDEAWACTTCGACAEVCPVLIDSVPGTLIGIRQHLVMTEGEMSSEVTNTMKNIERRGNPWGVGQDKRQDWMEGLDIPVFSEIAAAALAEGGAEREVEYLFWVGCAGATDDNAKKVQQALVRILKAAKVDFAVLGCEEKCTGDPARRMGNEMLFNQLAQENIEVMKQYKFKKIFTTCPHCMNSLKNEYGEFGVDYSVQHHTQLIAELLKDNRIPLDTKKHLEEHVTMHDPCYLGRYNREYDAPRETLYAIGGRAKLKEMERSKETSFCCGAGGGRLFMEEHIGDRVNVARTEQAVATGATTIAVGCPFCKSMLIDGTKTKNIEEQIKVRDVAELLAERLLPSSTAALASAESKADAE